MRRNGLRDVKPNPGHFALVEIENHAEEFLLVTQNVDGLHHLAGSRKVIEIHGNIWRTRCTACGQCRDRLGESLEELPRCEDCGGLLRPDVVWFGELLPDGLLERAAEAARNCDLFMTVGTSAEVYPAAGLLDEAGNATKIEVNLELTPASHRVDIAIYGKSGEVLPDLVRRAF